MGHKLFRQEAIDAQRNKLFGEVSLARPVPLWVFTLLAVCIAAGLIAFSIWGEYTRRERVEGYLALDAGAARIQTAEAGTLTDLLVIEGQEVEAGTPIATFSLDRSTGSAPSTIEAVRQQIAQRVVLLESEQAQLRSLGAQQVGQLKKRIESMHAELRQAANEIAVQERRVVSARSQAQRYAKLQGFASDTLVQDKEDDVIEQELKLEALKRQHAAVQRDLDEALLEEPVIALRTRTQIEQLSRQISQAQQELLQEDARREAVLRAPVAGVVTNIAVSKGASLSADVPIATIVPKGGGLHAELLVPTRAIGFLARGNQVVLRYEAFPFQRFGQYRGVVGAVGRTVWSPGERLGPFTVKEPVYRIDVVLQQQTVSLGAQTFSLRPGMLVSGDILLEKRTVLEWVFDPLLQLRERLK